MGRLRLKAGIKLTDVRDRIKQEAEGAIKLNRPAEQQRNLLKRNVSNYLDSVIEGGPIVELLSDAAIPFMVGLLVDGVEDLLELVMPGDEPVREPTAEMPAEPEPVKAPAKSKGKKSATPPSAT